jgi:membrane-bound lytic murein transglycosylase MltF
MLSDLQAMDLLEQSGKTNRLQYANELGATIARGLGQEPREANDKFGNRVNTKLGQAVRQSIPDWLASIAKGQANIVAGENVIQERSATVSAAAKASSDRMDVQQQKDAQTGDIRAQNIVDTSNRIIGYRAGGKDRYLSATELETLNGAGGGSATYGAAGTKPAAKAAPAAAPVQRTAQDEAALQWAQANPGDPRAAAILKRNGM